MNNFRFFFQKKYYFVFEANKKILLVHGNLSQFYFAWFYFNLIKI